jgi:hypothetical protein
VPRKHFASTRMPAARSSSWTQALAPRAPPEMRAGAYTSGNPMLRGSNMVGETVRARVASTEDGTEEAIPQGKEQVRDPLFATGNPNLVIDMDAPADQ